MIIAKLLDLKKRQLDLKLMERARIQNEIDELDSEISDTKHKIVTTSVNKHGAISDFAILQIHKDTMNAHIVKLNGKKSKLEKRVQKVISELKELLKESEQFDYLMKEQKKIEFAKILKRDMETTEEYIQSKYITNRD